MNADRAQYIQSSSDLITIVVMILFLFLLEKQMVRNIILILFRDQWSGTVPPYRPRFSDGYEPDPLYWSDDEMIPVEVTGLLLCTFPQLEDCNQKTCLIPSELVCLILVLETPYHFSTCHLLNGTSSRGKSQVRCVELEDVCCKIHTDCLRLTVGR